MVDAPPPARLGDLRTRYAALAHPYAATTVEYLTMKTRVAPFDHLAARQALNLAVDRNRITQLLGGPQTATSSRQAPEPLLAPVLGDVP